MRNRLTLVAAIALACLVGCARTAARPAAAAQDAAPATIVSPAGASFLESLAAKEVRRYVYLRTGTLLPILSGAAGAPEQGDLIIVAAEDRAVWRQFERDLSPEARREPARPEFYLLKTLRRDGRTVVLVIGGDPMGTLYGAYRFAEHLGVRFYLDGDVVPDERVPFALPAIEEELGKPLFNIRGIQPFHDFPEGPDWWNADDYKAIISQLVKLRMNFIGLHAYPEGRPNAEPAVWIGPAQDIAAGTKVKASYPASWQNTLRGNWGYKAKNTGGFSLGAANLFDRDAFGALVMRGLCPQPSTPEQCNEMFDRAGAMLADAFRHARALGVKTCVGTEIPLVVPKAVQERLKALGKDPADKAVIEELYEGIFRRLAQAHPPDYYWFWTPENWTWKGESPEELRKTLDDFSAAVAAAKKAGAPFTLATCGWVLGPQSDRALFDNVLPKDMPMSCINRQVGKSPVEPGFAKVAGRPKWAIPWMEDDPNLLAPQLWAGRMRKDAADALRYGCTGLLGIHWRTRILGPNVSALAQAAWQQPWPAGAAPQAETPKSEGPDGGRYAPCADFYRDFCVHQFGPQAGEKAAAVFTKIDGSLPQPSTWVGGPGGLKANDKPFDEVRKAYAFVDEFAALRPQVRGAGNLERFDYWMHNFQYMLAIERLKCAWGRKDEAAMKDACAEVYAHLLATVSTPGELGTVANWEQHALPALKIDLPKNYAGPARIIVPTQRTSLAAGETLDLRVILLAAGPPREAAVCVRPLGTGEFARAPLAHVARGVYAARISPKDGADFEYYIEVLPAQGAAVRWPAAAPALNQTVVVTPPERP